MSSFISRGAVLASARLLNQALMLLSPLLLVRLLDIVEYGRYRQFISVAADSWNANLASFGSYRGFCKKNQNRRG